MAHQAIQKALSEKRNLFEHEAMLFFKEYNLPVPEHKFVEDLDQAVQASEDIGYPVVLKVVSPDVLHKSDAGGVKLNLNSKEKITEAYHAILDNVKQKVPGADLKGMLVVSQASAGAECIMGMLKDKQFGPALMFGLGGIFVEILKDVSFRVLPITEADVREMIKETKAYQVLSGTRGEDAKDIDAVVESFLNMARLVEENPEIEEIDANPVMVYSKGLYILDARVIL